MKRELFLQDLEPLVKPFRDRNRVLEGLFRSLLGSNEVMLIPATLALWEQAAAIRAATRMRTPDSLYAAAALRAECQSLHHESRLSPASRRINVSLDLDNVSVPSSVSVLAHTVSVLARPP